MPWSITEQIRKYLMPLKRGGLQDRTACALWYDTQRGCETLFSFLCIAMPKSSWLSSGPGALERPGCTGLV